MPTITYREAINQALREEMTRDPRIFIAGEDVAQYQGAFKVTSGLLEEFGPRRVLDMPISEEVIVGLGIGAAMADLRPCVEMMTVNFIMLAMDQVVNHASKWRYMSGGELAVPLVIRAPGGGGNQLGAQHSQSLEAWFVHTPGLFVLAPATPYDAKGLLKAALRTNDPVLFLEHENLYSTEGDVPEEDYELPIGVGRVTRQGSDVTIVGYSMMARVGLDAAKRLANEGISCEVIDLRCLKPMDTELVLASVVKTGRLVCVEECWRCGGVMAEVVSQIQEFGFDYLDAPIRRVSGADVPMPYSKPLEAAALPDAGAVMEAVRQCMGTSAPAGKA
jgi:pyruvate dehydrogenase E1 component beta subunit